MTLLALGTPLLRATPLLGAPEAGSRLPFLGPRLRSSRPSLRPRLHARCPPGLLFDGSGHLLGSSLPASATFLPASCASASYLAPPSGLFLDFFTPSPRRPYYPSPLSVGAHRPIGLFPGRPAPVFGRFPVAVDTISTPPKKGSRCQSVPIAPTVIPASTAHRSVRRRTSGGSE